MSFLDSLKSFIEKPADDSEMKKEELIRQGVDAELAGKYDEAIKLYEEGGRPELVERAKYAKGHPEVIAEKSAEQTEKYPPVQ